MNKPLSAEVRREIARRAGHACSYCRSQEAVAGATFTIDHIIPQSLGGSDAPDNLCLACWDCNRLKHVHITGTDPESGERTTLFNPYTQNWRDHFRWEEGGVMIAGRTPTGRATVERLQLNRAVLVRARKQWVRAGWHPVIE